jgi:hypothetical protein
MSCWLNLQDIITGLSLYFALPAGFHLNHSWIIHMTVFKGSCLCQGVSYSIKGEALAFYHCHCQRCRKANGTGHASNIRIDTKHIEWQGDESLIHRYKVPDADRFRNDFCSACGSPMPRYFEEVGFVVLPAGTLDHEPPLQPQSRIFNASRAKWSCSNEHAIPCFDAYPE